MTDKTEAQPEALRLAERLDCDASDADMGRKPVACTRRKAAAELRRQTAEIQQLKAQLTTQANRAAEAEQLVTALTQRLDMANRLNTDAREQLAQLSARQAAPDGLAQLLQSLLQESCMPEGETYLSNEHYRKIHEFLQSPSPT